MKYKYIGLVAMFMIVVVGVVLSTGYADNNNGTEAIPDETPQNTTQNDTSTPDTALPTTASVTTTFVAPEKILAEALTCTKTTSGYELDIKLNNPSTEIRTVTINPSGRKVMLSAGITRVDIPIINESTTLNIFVDNGDQLLIQSPPCITRGGSEGAMTQTTEQLSPPTELSSLPPAPVPELPTLALTSVGIFGLLIVLRKRKD